MSLHHKDFTKYFFYILLSFSLISLVGLFSSESGSQHVFFNAQVTGKVITGMSEAGPSSGDIDLPMRNPSVDGVDNGDVLDEIERTKISPESKEDNVEALKKEVEETSLLPEGMSNSENEEVEKALAEKAKVSEKSEKLKEVSIGEMSGVLTNFWLWLKSFFVSVPKEKVLVGSDGSRARVSRDLSQAMDEFDADSVLFMDLDGNVNSYSVDGGEGKGNALLVVDGLGKGFVSAGGEVSLGTGDGEFLSLVPDFDGDVGYAVIADANSVDNVALVSGKNLVAFGGTGGKDGLPALGVVRVNPDGGLVVNTNDKAFDNSDRAKVVIVGNHQGGELFIGDDKVKVDPGQKELIVCLEESKSAVLVGSSGLLGITGMQQFDNSDLFGGEESGCTRRACDINIAMKGYDPCKGCGKCIPEAPMSQQLYDGRGHCSELKTCGENSPSDCVNKKEGTPCGKNGRCEATGYYYYKTGNQCKCIEQPCDATIPKDKIKGDGVIIGGHLDGGTGKIGGDGKGKKGDDKKDGKGDGGGTIIMEPGPLKTPEQQCAELGGSMYEGACVKCPANSVMSGGSCKCSSGFVGQGGQCVACSSYCSSQGLTEPLHSDPPNLKPCYESVSISKKVSQECSCAKTTVTYGNYPSYCTGTPCGRVECNKQASCTVGTTTYTVSCTFGGYGGSGGGQSQASVTTTTGTGTPTTGGGDIGGSSPGTYG